MHVALSSFAPSTRSQGTCREAEPQKSLADIRAPPSPQLDVSKVGGGGGNVVGGGGATTVDVVDGNGCGLSFRGSWSSPLTLPPQLAESIAARATPMIPPSRLSDRMWSAQSKRRALRILRRDGVWRRANLRRSAVGAATAVRVLADDPNQWSRETGSACLSSVR
jgi:hypothetical protein